MDRRVYAIIELMNINSRHPLSVPELARKVGLSPWHLTHLFKAETSKSPKEYLKEVRMQKAEEMLRGTLLSVKEVVSAVGLSDYSHFSREFKRMHALTLRSSLHNAEIIATTSGLPVIANPANK